MHQVSSDWKSKVSLSEEEPKMRKSSSITNISKPQLYRAPTNLSIQRSEQQQQQTTWRSAPKSKETNAAPDSDNVVTAPKTVLQNASSCSCPKCEAKK